MSAETTRKTLHLVAGLVPAIFLLVFGWTGAISLAMFLTVYTALGWEAQKRGLRVPILHALVLKTQRPEDPSPRGAFEFLLASTLVAILFPLPYALAALALLGVGDGVATLVGRAWGRRTLPWNPKKTWLGLAAGTICGVPAYAGFAILGAQLQMRGFSDALALDHPSTLLALGFLAIGFPMVHLGAKLLVDRGIVPRNANAGATDVTGRFLVALSLPLAFAVLARWSLRGPLLAQQGMHGPLGQVLLLLVPIIAMLAESVVRRHDNLVVSGVAAFGAWLLLGLLDGR